MTIKEIAELAGVSVSTVSKVMNGKDAGISAETRKRVLDIAKEYSYKPYSSALLQGGKTLVIGILTGRDAMLDGTAASICGKASELGYSTLLRQSDGTEVSELKGLSALIAQRVDAILWSPSSGQVRGLCERIESEGIPFLLFDADGTDVLRIDYAKLGHAATAELVGRGHAGIACCIGPGWRDRLFLEGYRSCLFENGIALDDELVVLDDVERLMRLVANKQVTGAVFSDCSMARLAYGMLTSAHYAIPGDVALISLRDDGYPRVDYPAISTLAVPHSSFGEHLAEKTICTVEKCEQPAPFEVDCALDSTCTVGAPSAPQRKRIVSFGSINIDNYLSFDALPNSGTSASTTRSAVYPGGKCLNEAIGAAKLDHAVAAMGRVGDDSDADVIYRELARYGVDADAVVRSGGMRTGQAYIFVDKIGTSMISIVSGANGALTCDDVLASERVFADAGICLLQTEVPIDAVAKAASTAKKHLLTTILKPSGCRELPSQLISDVDILVPNQDELTEICPDGATVEEKVANLRKRGAGIVIVTMGPDGCIVFDGDDRIEIPALDVASVDNTGAGDAFISALASYLLDGFSLTDAARIATYAAGLSTTRQGVAPSLVDKDTLETYILQHEPELLGRKL